MGYGITRIDIFPLDGVGLVDQLTP